jgi:uncharacterized repeat protein (TIGR01451 family)
MFAYINRFVSSLKIGRIFLVIALHLVLMVPSFSRAGGSSSNTDVAISKSANTTSALVGNTVVFTIGFTNFGSTTANNLSGTDVLPSGFSIFAWNSSGTPSAPVYNPTNGTWTIDAIAAGATDLLTISTTATNSGTYTNTALITSAGNMNNNAASVAVTLTPQTADLMVTKTAGLYDGPPTNQFQPGDVAEFTITITNPGPGTAYNIAGNDILPAGFTFDVWGNAGSGYYPQYNSADGSWTLYELPPGNWGSFSILASAAAYGIFTNTAAITSAIDSDPNPNNNTASVVVTIANQADLQMGNTANVSSVMLGQPVTFTLYLTNAGPGNVTNAITVAEVIPPGFQYVSDTSGGSFGSYSPGLVQWTLPSGWPKGFVGINITMLATNTGTYTNTATVPVPPGVNDPNLLNNTASAVVMVTQPQADLQVTKTVSTNATKLYQGFNFYVGVTNVGPVAVSNVVVTDVFPAGLNQTNWVGYGGNNQNYTPSNGVWTITNIPPGQGYLLSIGATGATLGSFTNIAQLTSSTPSDSNPANNMAAATVKILPLQADLAVTKTVFTNTLPVFSTFPFSFFLTVTNLGPDTVSNLTLTDLLPAGLTFGGAITNPGSFYMASNGLWSLSIPLAAGQGAAMTLVTGAPQIPGTFTNTLKVNVPATVTDPNLNNNSASVVVNVLPVYRILGYVANCSSDGIPLANVTLKLSGAANQTTTTFGIGNGNYSFDNVSNGVYTVTPSQPGNVFMPASAMVTVSNAWVTVPPFVGSVGLIYGQVTYFGNPVTNHPVMLSGGGLRKPRPELTDANGYYIFTNTGAGNYTVTVVATNGYFFTPTNPAVVLNAINCAAIVNFSATVPRVVQLVALEVVQVIQDWSNSVPLIQGKETYVRAHFQLTNNTPVLLQDAQLFNAGSAVSPLPPSTLLVNWTNAAVRPIREQLTNSLLFRLPADWLAGAINLQFVCTNNVTVVPTNVVPANSTVRVSFIPAAPLPVKIYPVNWTNAAGVVQQIAANNLADVPRRLLSMYPVPSVDAEPAPPLIMTTRMPPPYPQINARLAANRTLDWLSGFNFRLGFPPPNQRIYHGAVAGATAGGAAVNTDCAVGTFDGWGRGDSGLAIAVPSFVSSGLMPPNNDFYGQLFLRHLATHEIGHNLGRQHTVNATIFGSADGDALGGCNETAPLGTVYPLYQSVAGLYANKPALGPMNNGTNSLIFGLDTLTYRTAKQYNPIASPYLYFDVMSYAGRVPLSWWISIYNYTNIYNYVTNNFSGPPGGRPGPGPGTNWMIFRGLMDYSQNTAQFLPTLSVDTTILPPSPPPGSYSLVLFDSDGNMLAEIPFQPSADEVEDGDDETGSFMIPVETTSAIHEARVWNGTNFIADLMGSTSLPYVTSVTLSGTNGSFTGSGQLNISWAGGDADPAAQLSYTIEYSPDDGATWETLAVDWPYQSYSLDSQVMPASTQGFIRVIASDGLNNSSPQASGSFTILPHPPTILLNAPMDGSIFVADEQIFLDASVYDSQDGPLDGGSVQWVSSLDGSLGDGAVLNLEAGTLSEGTHLITVIATDSAGLTNSATVQIYILRVPPPQLAINTDGNGQADIAWPSSMTNYLLQASTNLFSGNWTVVTNVPAAADAEQTVTVDLAPTTRFFRLKHQ